MRKDLKLIDQLDDIKTQLRRVREKLNQGEIYQSVTDELIVIYNKIPVHSKVLIKPVEKNSQTEALIETMAAKLIDQPGQKIEDADLKIILEQLASPDDALRDRGAFFYLAEAISAKSLDDRQLISMTNYLIADDQLFSHIFEGQNDAVFGRSYSILMLSQLLRHDRVDHSFLDQELIDRIISQVAVYSLIERDTRGYVNQHGWAHAFTHLSDVYSELFKNSLITRADKILLIGTLATNLGELKTPLIMGEIQAIAVSMIYIINRHQLFEDFLMKIIKTWRSQMTQLPADSEEGWNQIFNRNRFFQALWLREDHLPEDFANYMSFANDTLT